MANRTAGRHRDTGRRPPSLFALDYPDARGPFNEFTDTAPLRLDGPQFGTQPFVSQSSFQGQPFGGQRYGSQSFGGQSFGGQRDGSRAGGGRRSGRRSVRWRAAWRSSRLRRSAGASPLTGRRALIVAGAVVLAGVVTAGIVTGFGRQDSPRSHRGEGAATPGIPLPALAPIPTAVAGGPGRRLARKRAPRRHPAAVTPPTPQPQGPAQAAPTPRVSSSAANRGPAISVRYLVPSQSFVGFEGEVVVVNNGQEALSGWQIVVALEGDTVTSVENASGFVSNGILLMQPTAGAPAIPPGGGTLRVFFTAEGTQTTPLACAFNGVTCG